jgi:hypothetical protein
MVAAVIVMVVTVTVAAVVVVVDGGAVLMVVVVAVGSADLSMLHTETENATPDQGIENVHIAKYRWTHLVREEGY